MVVGGDEEGGLATDKEEGPEAGTRRRAWRRGGQLCCWQGGGLGGVVVGGDKEEGVATDEEEGPEAGTRRRSCRRGRRRGRGGGRDGFVVGKEEGLPVLLLSEMRRRVWQRTRRRVQRLRGGLGGCGGKDEEEGMAVSLAMRRACRCRR